MMVNKAGQAKAKDTMNTSSENAPSFAAGCATAFAAGEVVLASLNNPREKFWGLLLALDPAGAVISGIDLVSFEDTVQMIRDGEPVIPAHVFFPMHRVERMERDASTSNIPSLQERFEATTGQSAGAFLRRS